MSQAVWRQGSSTTPSFAAGAPARASSRWSELPSPGRVADPADAAVAGVEDAPLDVRRAARRRRVQVEARAAADLVEREREPDVLQPAGALQPARRAPTPRGGPACPCTAAPRRRSPRATRRTRAPGPSRARGPARRASPTPGRVVVGPGRGRNAVGVRHRDHQAVGRRVPDPDHVARRALPRDAEPLVADAQPDRPEPRRDPLMRARARPPTPPAAAPAARATPQTCAPPRPTARRAASASTEFHKHGTSLSQTRLVPLHDTH